MPRETVGEFEKLVLLAILQLGNEAYGATIIREIERRTGRVATSGAVYVVLGRMEKKGLVRSEVGDPTPERGGRAKRFFTIRASGLQSLRQARREWDSMSDGLDGLLEPKG